MIFHGYMPHFLWVLFLYHVLISGLIGHQANLIMPIMLKALLSVASWMGSQSRFLQRVVGPSLAVEYKKHKQESDVYYIVDQHTIKPAKYHDYSCPTARTFINFNHHYNSKISIDLKNGYTHTPHVPSSFSRSDAGHFRVLRLVIFNKSR